MSEGRLGAPGGEAVVCCAKILREAADVAQEKAEAMLKMAKSVGDGGEHKVSVRKAKKLQGIYSLRKNQQNRARFYREAADILEEYADAVGSGAAA